MDKDQTSEPHTTGLSSPDTQSQTPDPRLFVNSVDRALRVLFAFDPPPAMLSIAEITRRTGLGRSAVQRFVYTLHQLGYLSRDAATRQYGLTARLQDQARQLRSTDSLTSHHRRLLQSLARETGETVAWVELEGNQITIIDSISAQHDAAVELPVGAHYPAMTSSSGQVLLSQASLQQLLDMLDHLSPEVRRRFGDRDTEEILALFARARRQGYSMTEKNLGFSTRSISAPVTNNAGRIVAAINVSTPREHYSADAVYTQLLPRLLATATQASQ